MNNQYNEDIYRAHNSIKFCINELQGANNNLSDKDVLKNALLITAIENAQKVKNDLMLLMCDIDAN